MIEALLQVVGVARSGEFRGLVCVSMHSIDQCLAYRKGQCAAAAVREDSATPTALGTCGGEGAHVTRVARAASARDDENDRGTALKPDSVVAFVRTDLTIVCSQCTYSAGHLGGAV